VLNLVFHVKLLLNDDREPIGTCGSERFEQNLKMQYYSQNSRIVLYAIFRFTRNILFSSTKIYHHHIIGNEIRAEGVKYLSDALRYNSTLTKLNVCGMCEVITMYTSLLANFLLIFRKHVRR